MNPKILKYAEWLAAVVLSATVLFLLIVRVTHAGPLWRDEAAALQLAQLPTIHDVASNFQHEAFPLPFPLLVRGYTGLFGSADSTLRWFGFSVGLATAAIAWFNAKALGGSGPSVFLGLFALSSGFLVWGTSLRGYGLGCALLLLTLGLTARAVRTPNRRSALAATIAATTTAQILVNSLPLLAALAAAAALVFIWDGKWRYVRNVCFFAAIPFICFSPYLKSYGSADWTIVLKYPRPITDLFEKFRIALGGQHLVTELFWFAAALLVLFGAIWHLVSRRTESNAGQKSALRFVLAFIPLAIIAYFSFLKILSYATQTWYYLPLVCALAGSVELITVLTVQTLWMKLVRISIAITALALLPITYSILRDRFTNIDLVAQKLQAEAAVNDLIVVNPWHFAPSFYRYYHGSTRWITNPTMNEHRYHRYDLMKEKMLATDPLNDVRAGIRETLQSYHRVWIVGGARPPEEGMPADLGPPPHPQLGWAGYISFWSIELGTFLNQHVTAGAVVIDRPANAINSENVPLLVAEGWRD